MAVERKKVVIGILLVLVITLPVFMATSWGLSIVEGIACDNAPDEWAASMQLTVADFYSISLRQEEARKSYGTFCEKFRKHPRVPYARFRIANSLEKDIAIPRPRAIEAYEAFLYEYGAEPNPSEELKDMLQKAERSITALKLR